MEDIILKDSNSKELEFSLLKLLLKDCEIKIDIDKIDPKNFRWMINKLILMRADLPIGEELLALQDKLLIKENTSSLINLNKIKFLGKTKSVTFSLLDSNADLLILIVNSFFDNNFNENEINSQIILKAGLEFKQDLFNIQKSSNNSQNDSLNIISGRNLNAKLVAEIIDSSLIESEDLDKIFSKVYSFVKENNLRNIALIVGDNVNKEPLTKILQKLRHNKKIKIFVNSKNK